MTLSPAQHADQLARVRAAELLAPTTSERRGVYAQRLARGYDPQAGSRIVAERIHGRQVPGNGEGRMKPYALGPRRPRFSRARKDWHPMMRAFLAKQERKERR